MNKRSKSARPISPHRLKEISISQETVPSARIYDPTGQTLYYNIVGPSMRPLLRPGDLLLIVPYRGTRVRRGDVVVFSPPGEKGLITHRIVSGRENTWRTRGDNNSRVDSWSLAAENIIGRVTHVQRGARPRRLASGGVGRVYGLLTRSVNACRRQLFRLLRPAYRSVAKRGFLWGVWPVASALKVISVARSQGVELRLLWGSRIIGKLPPHAHCWWIKPPFRLLIDEKRLPPTDHRRD